MQSDMGLRCLIMQKLSVEQVREKNTNQNIFTTESMAAKEMFARFVGMGKMNKWAEMSFGANTQQVGKDNGLRRDSYSRWPSNKGRGWPD